MYNERINPENPTLSEFSKAMNKNMNLNISNSYIGLPLDEDENACLNPFNVPEINEKNDEVFNNPEEELYYNPQKLSVQKYLFRLLGEKMKQKPDLLNKKIKKSKRNWNIMNKIKRKLIQDMFRDWINSSIKNPKLKLKKIEPKLLINKYKKITDICLFLMVSKINLDLCFIIALVHFLDCI